MSNGYPHPLAETLLCLFHGPDHTELTNLIPISAQQRFIRDAEKWPPVLRGGFEIWLSDAAKEPDFQQCFRSSDWKNVDFQHWLRRKSSEKTGAFPDCLISFLDQLTANPGSTEEIWLEYDTVVGHQTCRQPSIFVTLPHLEKQAARELVPEELRHVLSSSSLLDSLPSISTLVHALPSRCFISHIGFMLSREPNLFRINVKRLHVDDVIAYLKQIAWSGDLQKVEPFLSSIVSKAERFTLCLDVTTEGTVLPSLGIEMFAAGNDSSLNNQIKILRELNLLKDVQGEGLNSWKSVITPANSTAPWPRALIAESLQSPMKKFSVIDRSISHLKISWSPGRPIYCKAYLWFEALMYEGSSE